MPISTGLFPALHAACQSRARTRTVGTAAKRSATPAARLSPTVALAWEARWLAEA